MSIRNVRNFWLDADIDGRTSRLEGGPAAKDGGFDLDVLVREKGSPRRALSITGRANHNGTLVLRIWQYKPDGSVSSADPTMLEFDR